MFLKYLLVGIAAFLVDWIWAAYIIETARKAAVKSALLSGVIVLIGAFTTLAYMDEPTTINELTRRLENLESKFGNHKPNSYWGSAQDWR